MMGKWLIFSKQPPPTTGPSQGNETTLIFVQITQRMLHDTYVRIAVVFLSRVICIKV